MIHVYTIFIHLSVLGQNIDVHWLKVHVIGARHQCPQNSHLSVATWSHKKPRPYQWPTKLLPSVCKDSLATCVRSFWHLIVNQICSTLWQRNNTKNWQIFVNEKSDGNKSNNHILTTTKSHAYLSELFIMFLALYMYLTKIIKIK